MDRMCVLVTGGSRGIGRECVRRLAVERHRVLFTTRSEEAGRAVRSALAEDGLEADFLVFDQRDAAGAEALLEKAVTRLGRLDGLVNNAGILVDGDTPLSELDPARFADTLLTNLVGVFALCRAALPGMLRRRNGRIVNVSSGYGKMNRMDAGTGSYKVSKLALNGMTRILADECRGTGVLINAVCPGWVRTDMGGADADRSVEQGAASVLWALYLPPDGPTGGFFRDGKPLEY